MNQKTVINPHFDLGLIAWKDEYSGRFQPPPTGYSEQFDLQWHLSLKDSRYGVAPGASADDEYINDRIYEWTGNHPDGIDGFHDPSGGVRKLDHTLDPDLIRGKRCIDIGCGLGRWTRVMQKLGAREVLSIDMSPSALKGTSEYNPNTMQADIMRIPEEHPEWGNAFDFANLWGVAMCTHDPLKAFISAASTVRPGGVLYLMVYAPGGLHDQPLRILQRKRFYSLTTIDERLSYVEHVYHRRWDWNYPLLVNLLQVYANIRGFSKGNIVCILDMLEPFYNWVIPVEVINGWKEKGGFKSIVWLNEHEHPKCAHHVLLRK
ncbi:MAG: class I SAM-dependent methyltransferase [Candidatus Helarchaeota archaeon]|nr:class I SAM-dependent methyltransferase [Candidatus Helarchaeota archaeon]